MSLLGGKNTNLVEALVGVSDVEIILQLFKNTTYLFAEGVLERLLNPWGSEKICEYEEKCQQLMF